MMRIVLILFLVYYFVDAFFRSKTKIAWIPFSDLINLDEIERGGYGIIYRATWRNKTVAVKKFSNSKYFDSYFLSELRSLCKCCKCGCINRCYGVTIDPETNNYMLVLQFAKGGNLNKYLQTNFSMITWTRKVEILRQISMGLGKIHDINYAHRDLHSRNVLYLGPNPQLKTNKRFQIADLGLSQPINSTLSSEGIYGVMPYIAPEIFRGSAYSKESDIYSFGMIMWECTTGYRPFVHANHDIHLALKIIDGERPKITIDTPKFYADLMRRCWDSDPKKRPSVNEIHRILSDINNVELDEAERKRLKLIQSKELGPEFIEKPHSEAIYESRFLSSYSPLIKQDDKGYITRAYEIDILICN